ncbi:MAG: hypothetical protein FWB99_01600 [Treponema sp.]|nr:hypothetical protein [Treponema sp.]
MTTNETSINIYNIRLGVDDPAKPIYQLTDDAGKVRIKQWCDNYFDSLNHLDQLREISLRNEPTLLELWPFGKQDDSSVRTIIEEWVYGQEGD